MLRVLVLTRPVSADSDGETPEATARSTVDLVITREELDTGALKAEVTVFHASVELLLKSGDAHMTCPTIVPPGREVISREKIHTGCWVELNPGSTGEIAVDSSRSALSGAR